MGPKIYYYPINLPQITEMEPNYVHKENIWSKFKKLLNRPSTADVDSGRPFFASSLSLKLLHNKSFDK